MLEQLQEWMEYIQQPGKLGNNPICPFASKTVKQKRVDVTALTDIRDLEMLIDEVDVTKFDVSIFYFEQYLDYSVEELENKVKYLNSIFKAQDKVILDNDPRNPFIVNGHQTTFNGCYLYVVQSLSDLTQASNRLKMGDYYSYWTQTQYGEVVGWR
jgi:hypothetical protein